MPQLSTGLVIAGAYADKVRRVAFAQLRDELRKGNISSDVIVRRTAELNRLLYDILVNRLKIDKGDVVRIRIEYEVENGDLKWKLDTLQIEAFRRVPDEEVRKAIRETVKAAEEVLAAPPTAEEREWIEEREAKPAKPEAIEKPWRPSEDLVHETPIVGELSGGGYLALVNSSKGASVGMVSLKPANGRTRVLVVLVPTSREAYKAETTVDKSPDEISEDEIRQIVLSLSYEKIDVQEAEKIIREEKSKLI